MALHDTVVRRIKTHHERLGDEVTAELPGYAKPPRFYGSRGAAYIPDVFVYNQEIAYEVKEYHAARYAGPKLKALINSPAVREVVLVLCTGTSAGVGRVRSRLRRDGLRCKVLSYRDLPFW